MMFRGWVQRPSGQTVQKLTGECPRVPYHFDPYKPPKNEETMTPIQQLLLSTVLRFTWLYYVTRWDFANPWTWKSFQKTNQYIVEQYFQGYSPIAIARYISAIVHVQKNNPFRLSSGLTVAPQKQCYYEQFFAPPVPRSSDMVFL